MSLCAIGRYVNLLAHYMVMCRAATIFYYRLVTIFHSCLSSPRWPFWDVWNYWVYCCDKRKAANADTIDFLPISHFSSRYEECSECGLYVLSIYLNLLNDGRFKSKSTRLTSQKLIITVTSICPECTIREGAFYYFWETILSNNHPQIKLSWPINILSNCTERHPWVCLTPG